ncbi:MAG: asparagine synthase (glutamine-hydrolyzing) [bacterium]
MCGICGVFNYGIKDEVKESLITSMRDTIVHRGPDDAGVYISRDKGVGFGFRRLSIIDLAGGHQPMPNEDGSVWIVFNGEIYNHLDIRRELERRGHRYKTRSDTETIIHLYEEKGRDCVHDLRGMFAFAIWDEKRRQIFLARDRIGIKPLYYTFQNGVFIFGSEIKAILAHPGVKRDVDEVALYHYLTFVTTPAPMTLFKGIEKIPPGYSVVVNSDGEVSRVQYWDAIIPNSHPVTYDENYYIENIRSLLRESVKLRMMSDVPFGVFLSGGIDSSTNVALMAELMDRPVDTFSVGFKDNENYNELNYARQIAREFSTNHHEVLIDHQDLVDYIPKLIYHQDEPIADWVCVPLYYVSDLVRKSGTIVVQVGEGSDEQFCGYDGYMQHINAYRYWRHFANLPGPFKKGMYNLGRLAVAILKRGRGKLEALKRAVDGEELFWGGAIAYRGDIKKKLIGNGNSDGRWKSLNSHDIVRQYISKIRKEKPEADFLERMIYLELKIRLPELLLMRVDKVTMSTSIEARVPFLDHKLVEFTMGIPTSLKIKNGVPKYILKKACEGIIPENIIYRKKQGFGAPVSEWFGGELEEYARESIMNSRIRERGFFDYDFIEYMLSAHRKREADYSFYLWNIFNLSKWYDYWVEGEKM